MTAEADKSSIKQLQSGDLQNCFSFWDFEHDTEKRTRLEREIESENRRMYAYLLNGQYEAGMSLSRADSDAVLLSYLVVEEKYRNQGIGTKMIDYACRLSKGQGFKFIILSVEDGNLGAERLYERLGFTVDGTDDRGRKKMKKAL